MNKKSNRTKKRFIYSPKKPEKIDWRPFGKISCDTVHVFILQVQLSKWRIKNDAYRRSRLLHQNVFDGVLTHTDDDFSKFHKKSPLPSLVGN